MSLPLNLQRDGQLTWPLYTFLGIVILLVILAGFKLVGAFMQIRLRRRMVQETIRNGTYVPPTPPNLTIKPELWEAYLGGSSGCQLGSGKKGLDTNWKSEYSRDYWESIKPIYAGLTKPGSPPNFPTSLSQPPSIPVSTLINLSVPPRGDDEENQRTAEVSTTPPSLLTRARIFLHLNSSVPASSSTLNNNGTSSHSISVMSVSNSPPPQPMIRVVVLIAMPSLTSSHVSTTLPLSARTSSSLSSNSQPTTTSHSPELSPSPTTTLRFTDDEDQPVPYLEMGVADVGVVRSRTANLKESLTWDSAHTTFIGRGEERTWTNPSRGNNLSYSEP